MPPDPQLELERRIAGKVARRLIPLAFGAYFVACIDRTNVAFAALTMNHALGISPSIFGWGAGIFFLGYSLFEVPSNLLLERFGARRWIARIMITWGLASGAMAFATGPKSFVGLRLLLGVAEAGLYPGLIFYFTNWFPASYRARIFASLYIASPLASAVASAASGAILGLDGFLGLAGWRWLFIIEALPTLVLAIAILGGLTDRPSQAQWLEPSERDWLETRLAAERTAALRHGALTLLRAFTDARTLVLITIYFAYNVASYGVTFFLPQILKQLGLSNLRTGLATALPYLVGAAAAVFMARSSDRSNDRRGHLAASYGLGAVGLTAAAILGPSPWALAAFCVAAAGLMSATPVFWPLPSRYLAGTAAAAGIALVNAVGCLGGLAGPYAVGRLAQHFAGFTPALFFLAASALVAAIISRFFITNEG